MVHFCGKSICLQLIWTLAKFKILINVNVFGRCQKDLGKIIILVHKNNVAMVHYCVLSLFNFNDKSYYSSNLFETNLNHNNNRFFFIKYFSKRFDHNIKSCRCRYWYQKIPLSFFHLSSKLIYVIMVHFCFLFLLMLIENPISQANSWRSIWTITFLEYKNLREEHRKFHSFLKFY